MTATEFIGELKRVRNLLEWKSVPDTNWTPDRRSHPRLHIRATSEELFDGVLFEPIGAVCYVWTGLTYQGDSRMAARWLRLSEADASEITAASHDLTWRQVGELRRPDPRIQLLRNHLAAAVGLDMEAAATEEWPVVRLRSQSRTT